MDLLRAKDHVQLWAPIDPTSFLTMQGKFNIPGQDITTIMQLILIGWKKNRVLMLGS